MSVVCLYAAAFFLQPAVMKLLAYQDMGPDLLLCLTILLIAADRDPGLVAMASTAAALLQDICYALYVGPGAAAAFAAALCAALAFRLCAWEGSWLLLALAALETLIYHMVLWTGNWVFGGAWTFLYMLRRLPIWILYNGAICAGVYLLLTKERKEPMKNE